ncbi:MAG: hypothetical protein MUE52_14380 [Tabrizicola sp.]|jgi:hypothetical protein|nr:hypothetical protein [Tabrizicola sp.]
MRLTALSGLAVLLLTGMAQAGGSYIEVLCEQTSVDGQFTHCQRPAGVFSFVSEGDTAEYSLKLTAPSTHCALTAYTVSTVPDGFVSVGTTPFIDRDESSTIPIGSGYPAGPVTMYIFGTGKIGGCNVGEMHSWGVTVEAQRSGP